MYVIDEASDAPGEYRVFVSRDGILYRQVVNGSGSGTDNGTTSYSVSVDDGGIGFSLFVEVDAESNVRMAIIEGPTDERIGIPAEAQILETVNTDALDMPVENLPAGQEVEYFTQVETGERLLVVRPRIDWSYEDFRVFYGNPNDVLERDVLSVERARDGGSTHILFELPNGNADAFFPVEFDGTMFNPGPMTLTVDNVTQSMQPLDPTTSAFDAMTFRCVE